jgi:outer membrane immunogenic protein
MKRVLLSAVAFSMLAGANLASAADLPLKAPPAPVAVAPWWTGFYVGINGGYSWGRSETNVSWFNSVTGAPIVPPAGSISSATFDMNGGIFGGQIGYNAQFNNFVVGVETDIQWSGQKGNTNFLCAFILPGVAGVCAPGVTGGPPLTAIGTTMGFEQKLEWFGTLRGRAGLLVTPDWLAYVTGGLAYGEIQTNTTLSTFNAGGGVNSTAATSNVTNVGWTVGVGLEGRFWQNWSAKLEYLYMDLGTVSGTIALAPPPALTPPIGANWSSKITDNIFRVGVNSHWK